MEKYTELKERIRCKIKNADMDNLEDLINEYCDLLPNDLDTYSMRATVEYMNGNFKNAKLILKEGVELFKFNFDLNYNLGMIASADGDYEQSLYSYYVSLYLIKNKEDMIGTIEKNIMDVLNMNCINSLKANAILEDVKSMFLIRHADFPKKVEGTYLNSFVEAKDKKSGSYVAYYDKFYPERDGFFEENLYAENFNSFEKIEILKGTRIKDAKLEIDMDTVVPICKINKDSKITIKTSKDKFDISNNLGNRFYYYNVNNDVEIKSNENFILGKPIKKLKNKNKKELVLNIFVDGLSQKFLDEEGMENLMPNTYKYFSKGAICSNAYVTGEWTYTNMASFFTGKNTVNHKMFHPNFNEKLPVKDMILSEYLNKNGYFTCKIDGDWRSTPTYGYMRGIDRFVYQPAVRGMDVNEVIDEAIEHIESFGEMNKFMWIGISDLHDIADEFQPKLSSQINLNLQDRIIKKDNTTSVRKKYDITKINRYREQIKIVDRYLGLLFNYLEQNFDDKGIFVSLISDHGQGYLVKEEDFFLSDSRTNVAFMFRGGNINSGICEEFIEGLDLMPIILNNCNIKMNSMSNLDCNLPEYFGGNKSREYVYSESIFPESTYKAFIKSEQYDFCFESVDLVCDDGRVNLDKYSINLFDRKINKIVADDNLINKFTNLVMEHMKYNRIY